MFSKNGKRLLQLVKKSSNIYFNTRHIVNLAKNNYNVQKGNFNNVEEKHVHFFKNLLGNNRVLTESSDVEKYNLDWMNLVRGYSSLVLKPKSTEEISKILSFCNDNKLAVCPQGGNTSIAGGSVPIFDEIIISLELMNEILNLDENAGVMVCQAGCILEHLDDKLAEKNLMVPLDLGAKGSCQIGGNISSNAGGLRLLRYGNLHGNVLGVEAVTGTGEVIDCLSGLRKDNTGYHLKHLFIGSEGTLGIVTKVAFQCPPRPNSINVAFLGLDNYENILRAYSRAKQDLSEILSAFEVIDAETLVFAKEKLGITSPIGEYPFYLLIETSGSNQKHDSEKLENFLESGLKEKLILSGTVATDPTKVNAIWNIREKIPQGFKQCGCIFCYDFSLPLEYCFTFVDDIRSYMENKAIRVFAFGHLGDGNVHLQIEMKEFSIELKNYIEPYIFEKVLDYNGSISAEHGMGFLKANYLSLTRTPNTIQLMCDLKKYLDPNGILNPYKMFPWDNVINKNIQT